MGPDERTIRELQERWIDAVNARDLVRLLALRADDVVFLNPGRAPFGCDGSPAAAFGPRTVNIRSVASAMLQEITVIGEVAYTLCRDSLSVTPRVGGQVMELAGRRITICHMLLDGRWLLARGANILSLLAC